MSAALVTVERPDSTEEELRYYRVAHHNCPEFMNMIQTLGRIESAGKDMFILPVGIFGYGMPMYTPFMVTATMPCEACQRTVNVPFQWAGRTVIDLGALKQ